MRFLALAHLSRRSFRTDIARFLKVSRTSVNKWVSNFLLHGVVWGWIVSVHQADPPSSAPNSYPSLANISTNKSRLAIGDDCKVLIFKRISSGEFVWPMNSPRVYRLREWGFLITSRSRHPKQDGRCRKLLKTSS